MKVWRFSFWLCRHQSIVYRTQERDERNESAIGRPKVSRRFSKYLCNSKMRSSSVLSVRRNWPSSRCPAQKGSRRYDSRTQFRSSIYHDYFQVNTCSFCSVKKITDAKPFLITQFFLVTDQNCCNTQTNFTASNLGIKFLTSSAWQERKLQISLRTIRLTRRLFPLTFFIFRRTLTFQWRKDSKWCFEERADRRIMQRPK